MAVVLLRHDARALRGIFERGVEVNDGAWLRLRSHALEVDSTVRFGENTIDVGWRHALHVLRAMAPLQVQLGFSFDTDTSSAQLVDSFVREFKAVRGAANTLQLDLTEDEIGSRLADLGWNTTTHPLKPYQLKDLRALLTLKHGANFSVPGAGKTTVTFALHLLSPAAIDRLLIVAPRNAFMAWEEVASECLLPTASAQARAPFVPLVGGEANITAILQSKPRRLLISYDQMVRVEPLIEDLLARERVHLVLDEAHRMKAGGASRRGAVLLDIGYLATRRDILTGTPMPQRPGDMQSQLDFLWPGAGLGGRIGSGESPRQVLGRLYVRTTKRDLDLEPRKRIPVWVTLSDAHLAFYSVLKSDVHAQASKLRRGRAGIDLIRARRSVMRLLQASVNPQLLAAELADSLDPNRAQLLQAVISEGPSARLLKAVELAREFAAEGRKTLIWTNFRSTIQQLRLAMQDLEPTVIDGSTTVGEEDDDETRQGQIRRFKTDDRCKVLIANPAAASEGMSLHHVCHDAIYVDRSYNATHFLQSVDRIHRLGLPKGTETRIYVLQNRLPPAVGSIDVSVARRLGQKIRAMEALLGDVDLHELALDEESVGSSLEDSIDIRDIEDLVAELENRGSPDTDDLIV